MSYGISVTAALLALALGAPAAQPQANAPVRKPATSAVAAAPPAEPVIPKSVFIVPRTPQQGRDPFYPNSARLSPQESGRTSRPTFVAPVAELRLKAISGAAGAKLATINSRIFAVGEEGDVVTSSGRTRIRCLEINEDSVVIQVGSERRELRFRHGF
jgi:hypothetical protein